MKAVVQHRYGPPREVLRVEEVGRPELPPGGVLIRVRAAAVPGGIWHLAQGLPYVARSATGLRRPKVSIPGSDLAGVVEAVGDQTPELSVGDEVFGIGNWAFAELAVAAGGNLAPKPAGLTFEQAAAVPDSGLTALQALRDGGEVEEGMDVLIVGASGGTGSFAVQIAKAMGAKVTGVCSTASADTVRSLGADEVIDYTREDFTAGDRTFDVIVDIAGGRSHGELRRALARGGVAVLVANVSVGGGELRGWDRLFMGTGGWIGASVGSLFSKRKIRPFIQSPSRDDLIALGDLIEAGKIKPLVDATYPVEDVHAAVDRLGAGHGRGKIVLTI